MSRKIRSQQTSERTRRFRFNPLRGSELELAIEREFGRREADFVATVS